MYVLLFCVIIVMLVCLVNGLLKFLVCMVINVEYKYFLMVILFWARPVGRACFR